MKVGDKAKASPQLTGESDWVEGEVIDIEHRIHLRVLSLPLRTKWGGYSLARRDISSQLNCKGSSCVNMISTIPKGVSILPRGTIWQTFTER